MNIEELKARLGEYLLADKQYIIRPSHLKELIDRLQAAESKLEEMNKQEPVANRSLAKGAAKRGYTVYVYETGFFGEGEPLYAAPLGIIGDRQDVFKEGKVVGMHIGWNLCKAGDKEGFDVITKRLNDERNSATQVQSNADKEIEPDYFMAGHGCYSSIEAAKIFEGEDSEITPLYLNADKLCHNKELDDVKNKLQILRDGIKAITKINAPVFSNMSEMQVLAMPPSKLIEHCNNLLAQ